MKAIDDDAATVAGYWVGIAGFIVGMAGVGLTLYTMFRATPDALAIAGSGWLAAVLVTVTSWRITGKLLSHTKNCERERTEAMLKTQAIQTAHDRLATIGEFLATKTMRPATPRAASTNKDKADPKEDGKDVD